MRKAVLSLVFMFLATAVTRAEIPWQDNLRAAHAQAEAEGKLLLLHFYGDNCVWCDRLEAGAFQSPEVNQAITSQFVPVKIHVGKDPSLARTFKVTSLPTDVVVTTKGNALSHGVSPQKPGDYVNMLASAARLQPAMASSQMIAQAPPVVAPPAQIQAPVAQPAAVAPPAAQLQMPVAVAAAPQTPANGFVLPAGRVGAVSGQTVGIRTDGMTLGMPGDVGASVQSATSAQSTAPAQVDASGQIDQTVSVPVASVTESNTETPPLAMEGFCAVSVMDDGQWVEGNPKHGVIHLGRLYLFGSADKRTAFLADPVSYTPVMNGIDVIRFFEERKIVQGKRDYGVKDQVYGRMFFFADAAARDHFENQYERYTDAAIEVMKQAVSDANPGN